jgi:hypothetical protein
MPTQRSPVRLMVEATRPGLPGLSSLSLNLRGLGLQKGHAPPAVAQPARRSSSSSLQYISTRQQQLQCYKHLPINTLTSCQTRQILHVHSSSPQPCLQLFTTALSSALHHSLVFSSSPQPCLQLFTTALSSALHHSLLFSSSPQPSLQLFTTALSSALHHSLVFSSSQQSCLQLFTKLGHMAHASDIRGTPCSKA